MIQLLMFSLGTTIWWNTNGLFGVKVNTKQMFSTAILRSQVMTIAFTTVESCNNSSINEGKEKQRKIKNKLDR